MEAVVSDGAWKHWFPQGAKPGRTFQEYSYDKPLVQAWVVPLLPPGATNVLVNAVSLDATFHTMAFSVPLKGLTDPLDRVDIWTSHPTGWYLEDQFTDAGRSMYGYVRSKEHRCLNEPLNVSKLKGELSFGFLRRLPVFRHDKEPLAEKHWCLVVTYRLPATAAAAALVPAKKKAVKPKPKDTDDAPAVPAAPSKPVNGKPKAKKPATATTAVAFTKKAVEEMLTKVLTGFTSQYGEYTPNPKELKDKARKNYPKQQCTVFEFLNAYDLDQAAKGGHPLKQVAAPSKAKTKGTRDVGPTDDEEEPEETKAPGRKKPEARTECQARLWMRNLASEASLRFTDTLFDPEELLKACHSDVSQSYLSSASEVTEALRPFIDDVHADLASIKPRCADAHYSIPSDAFNQRVSAQDELIRVCDRFVLRLKAVRMILNEKRKADLALECCVPPKHWQPSGLLREANLGFLEYVTQLELGAVVGLRQTVQWKTAFATFFSKALEPLQNEEVHLTLDLATIFFTEVLMTFTARPPPAASTGTKRVREPKAATTPAKEKAPAKATKAPAKASGKTGKANGKAEVVSASESEESGSDTDDASSSSGSDESSSGDDEPDPKRSRSEEQALEERYGDGGNQVTVFSDQIRSLIGMRIDEAPFARTIQLLDMKKYKLNPSVNYMENHPIIAGFFRQLCKELEIKECTTRFDRRKPVVDPKATGSYVFQPPSEPESYIILSFDPFSAPPNGLTGGNLDAITCALVSQKAQSQLKTKFDHLITSRPMLAKHIKIINPNAMDTDEPVKKAKKPIPVSASGIPIHAGDNEPPMPEPREYEDGTMEI